MPNKGVPASTIMTNAAVTPAVSSVLHKIVAGFIDHAVEEFRLIISSVRPGTFRAQPLAARRKKLGGKNSRPQIWQ